ncbi:uncharacterized protein EI90DRAFT_3054571, partial [Cantharellus anzutake]|uniref:uncharacterized protein n=1 Tax=Cantharellus anzutake TaxID=1750568 RepID=UPI001905E1E8
MLSLIISSLFFAWAFATPFPRVPQLHCNIVDTGAEYLVLENKTSAHIIPGVYSKYRLKDALKAAGSHANPGTNPMVVVDTEQTSLGFNSNLADFESCKSNYMGFPAQRTTSSGKKHWYGHVRLYGEGPKSPNSPKLCLTKHWISPSLQFLTGEPCSYKDDASQENQYFDMLELGRGYELADYLLTQIGAPSRQHSKNYYYLPGTAKAPAFTVHPDQNTGYALHFSYVHV